MTDEPDFSGLNELDDLSRELEQAMEEEITPNATVNVTGDREENGVWNHVNVRVINPGEGIEYERQYEGFPRMEDVMADIHKVH